ncbi:MAG: hypothetical protein ACKVOU_06690 [Cytophagales bacterium]
MTLKYYLLAGLLFLILCLLSCSTKQYPCPAYSSHPGIQIDSTGQFSGGYRHNKDKKTGLIVKKKSKNLYDRKSNARIF